MCWTLRFSRSRANSLFQICFSRRDIFGRDWNLRLKNGVDVRLPEFDVEQALDQLAALERDAKLSNRDITTIDLRLADRITVRLSDGAFQAREEAAKKKLQKPRGGNA